MKAAIRTRINLLENKISEVQQRSFKYSLSDVPKLVANSPTLIRSDLKGKPIYQQLWMISAGIVILVLMIVCVMAAWPFEYASYLYDKDRDIRKLRLEMRWLKNAPPKLFVPPDESLFTRWRMYGFDQYDDHKTQLNLLQELISILYGQEVSDSIDVHQIYQDLAKQQLESKIDYYSANSPVHFYFAPLIDSVITTAEYLLNLIIKESLVTYEDNRPKFNE